MKRLLSILAALLLTVGSMVLTGCSNTDTAAPADEPASTEAPAEGGDA